MLEQTPNSHSHFAPSPFDTYEVSGSDALSQSVEQTLADYAKTSMHFVTNEAIPDVNETPLADEPEEIIVSEPVHSEPVHCEPVHSEPVHSEPVHSEPVHSEPVHSEPVHSKAAKLDVANTAGVEQPKTETQANIVSVTAKTKQRPEVTSEPTPSKEQQKDLKPAKKNDGELPPENQFLELALSPEVQQAVVNGGYTTPTDVQREIIPHVLAGRDVLAQSQTGTGKTAAFALPILSRIDVNARKPQVLVLAPTRELAVQVAESFATYGSCIKGFTVAAVYGGQSYEIQLRQLRRGVPVVVGTPGRVIDHIKRGTLDLSGIECIVLDEADEMLNMGFLDDVRFVLDQAPPGRQIALFSATLPAPICSIAEQYQSDPVRIMIKRKTMTVEAIRQRAVFVAPRDKIDVLMRFLEAEETDGVIVFTKTREATVDVADQLIEEGFSAVALNGDMPQAVRERAIDQLKSGKLNVLVATDVAARGLDVSRISHVFNFDVPHDNESYIHRIGRTGRAGRSGEAIIFLTNNQRHRLRSIERSTRQSITVVQKPSVHDINANRVERFRQKLTDVTASEDLSVFRMMLAEYAAESGLPMDVIAAAVAHIGQNGRPFFAAERPNSRRPERREQSDRSGRPARHERGERRERDSRDNDRGPRSRQGGPPKPGMDRYRIEVGRKDGVMPGNIVGAVANEAGLDGKDIGPITIHDSYSTVDLPEGMPREVHETLQQTWVSGKQLRISKSNDGGGSSFRERDSQSRKPHASKDRGKKKQFGGSGSMPDKNRKRRTKA